MKTLAFAFPALLWLSYFAHVVWAKPVIVSLPGRSVQLRGEVGDFGYQFDNLVVHSANLFLAPEEDPFLCSYPSSLEGLPPRNVSTPPSPIALFVSRGECSFEEKARVALALQQNLTQELLYVIIYNNDAENPSQVIRMGGSDIDIPSMGFLAVSTRAGSYTMSSILYYAETTGTSPYFGVNATEEWKYPVEIEKFQSYSESQAGTNAFYVLRFVLFGLLIVAPCFRAAYLWSSGGGRILFRRNERGRIIGLRIIRPAPYWFAPTAQEPGRPERRQLMTEAQVRALPEIIYTCTPDAESTDDEQDDASVESGAPLEPSSADPADTVHPVVEERGQAERNESSVPLPPVVNPEGLTTSCTSCSICIDDFENGERLRVLPKCSHAFHTDCLMPWLTERQSCCPLCKRNVLSDGTDGSEDEDGNRSDVEQGLRPAESNAIAEEEIVVPVAANLTSQGVQQQEEVAAPGSQPTSPQEEVICASAAQEETVVPAVNESRGSEQLEGAKQDARLDISPV